MELYPHQAALVERMKQTNMHYMAWEMGVGKTLGAIECMRLWCNTNRRLLRTVILSPSVTLYNWKEEIKMFSKVDKDKILVCVGSGAKRVKTLETHLRRNHNEAIIVINYEALLNKGIMYLLEEWLPEIVIADECQYIKNSKAQRSRAAVKLGSLAKYRLALSGTPILNSIMDIFGQYLFLDQGASFGRNEFVFRRKYMIDKNAGMPKFSYFPNWVPNPSMFEDLQDRIYAKASKISKHECLDLPPLIKTTRHVEMGPDQKRAYVQMRKEFITFVKNEMTNKSEAVVATLALTKALRLMQILSGFVTTDDGNVIEFDKVPRLDAALEVIQEVTPNHKIILWCSYRQNYKQLARVCEQAGIDYVFLTGEMTAIKKQEAMNKFRTDPKVRAIIANRKAGGIGVNLVEASYSLVYSKNFSLEEELQSEARNHRGGSQVHESVVKINLCVKDTIDEVVTKKLESKQKLSDSIMELAGEL